MALPVPFVLKVIIELPQYYTVTDLSREKSRHAGRSKSSRDTTGDDAHDQLIDKREGKENIDK